MPESGLYNKRKKDNQQIILKCSGNTVVTNFNNFSGTIF